MENSANIKVIEEDVRQALEYGEFMERIGWSVQPTQDKKGKKISIFIRKLGPIAIAKIQRPEGKIDKKELENFLVKNRVFMCKFEPAQKNEKLIELGFRQDDWPLLASKTLRVDLSPSEENILKSFNKDARYCIRRVQDTGYRVQRNEFDKFNKIWRRANKIKGIWTPSERDFWSLVKSFGGKCFCVTLNDQGGCLVLLHKKAAYYFYSGTLPVGKKYDLPYAVVWEAMKEAKKRGAEVWDFEGIYDPRWPLPQWKGFSHFKKSFGGVEVDFPGCFTKWRWPF